MAERTALLIHNNYYVDKTLAHLKTPNPDVRNLAAALRDPEIGDFDHVEKITNGSADDILQQVRTLFHRRKRYDVLLLYITAHLLLDEQDRLCLAVHHTRVPHLAETTIPISALIKYMDRSFSRRQIIIFDCHNGIVGLAGNEMLGPEMGLADLFGSRKRGRIVLAATDTIQYILTMDGCAGEIKNSHFTHYLVQGLSTGAADRDQDGQIGLDELFDYADTHIRHISDYRPRKWTYQEQDKFIVAHNPNRAEPERRVKWNLIFGGTLSPLVTLIIGGAENLTMSIGMACLFALLYIFLYSILD